MRLKEPLYGVIVAGMHFIFHICMGLTMIFQEIKRKKDGDIIHDIKYDCIEVSAYERSRE